MRIYTRELLDKYLLPELKEIAQGFGISPDGDKRCRQNWIDAIVGVNPPLLQLLEASPAASVVPGGPRGPRITRPEGPSGCGREQRAGDRGCLERS